MKRIKIQHYSSLANIFFNIKDLIPETLINFTTA